MAKAAVKRVERVENDAPAPARAASKDSSQVTYIPRDGDPIRTVWNGVEFRANIPVVIPHSKMVNTLVVQETKGPEGDIRTKGVETKTSMVEMAKTNPFFEVDGVQHVEHKNGVARLPIDSDQYRGYALVWIRATNTLKQLKERWDGEEPLREKCGLEVGDINYLRPFLDARREQLGETTA